MSKKTNPDFLGLPVAILKKRIGRALRTIKLLSGHVLRTATAFYQRPFNKEWDSLLASILDKGELLEIGKHTVDYIYEESIYSIWIANRWFAYGHLNALDGKSVNYCLEFRPKFKTMVLLYEITGRRQAEVINHDDDYRRIYSNK